MTVKKLRFGIVGVGGRGLGAFGTPLANRENIELVAFCDNNPIRMEKAAQSLDIQPDFFATVPEMCAACDLDAVVITTPDKYHEQHAVEALEAGVNVLIDKPLAITVEGCQNIVKAAEKSGRTVMIGFNLRHNPVLKKLKQIISEGTIGRPFLIENREFYKGGRTYMARWNRHYDQSGGLWIHKGSHDFDVFQWLLDFPRPVRVSAFSDVSVLNMDNLPFETKPGVDVGPTCHACAYKDICPDYNDLGQWLDRWNDETAKIDGYYKDLCIYSSDKSVHDNGIAIVEYDNGARASHLECFVTPIGDRLYTVVGTLGQVEASLTNRTITVRPRWNNDTTTHNIAPREGGHGGADPSILDSFISILRGEQENTSTTEHGMMSTAVGQAAELSWREKRMVEIDELF